MSKTYKQIIGTWGERQAAAFLLRRGYLIMARNVRSKFGEIDIIAWTAHSHPAQSAKTLSFIEVKTRSHDSVRAEYATDARKQRKLHATAIWFCARTGIDQDRTHMQFEHISIYVNRVQRSARIIKFRLPICG